LFLGVMPSAPEIQKVHESLQPHAHRLANLVREHSHQFKVASKHYSEQIVAKQCVQARLADSAMWLHAWACTLSRLDHDIRSGQSGPHFERDKAAAMYFFDMAAEEIHRCHHDLLNNSDDAMRAAAEAALRYSDSLPNSDYVVPEASPNARGTGRPPKQDGIKQFAGKGHGGNGEVIVERRMREVKV